MDVNGMGPTCIEIAGHYVLVSFLHSEHPELPLGYGGLMEPLRFKTLVFSAQDGTLKTILHWQARRQDASLLPAQDGGFVVHAGDVLMRYSPLLKLVKRLDLPATEPASHYRSAYSTIEMLPGGRILFHRTYKETPKQLESEGSWINVDSFERLASIPIPDWRPVVPSFDTFVRSERSSVHVRQNDGWHTFFHFAEGNASMFLDNHLLLLTGRKKVAVIDTSGNQRMSAELNERDPKISKRSLNGNRFAVCDTEDARRLLKRPDLFEGRYSAKVFDLHRGGLVAEIDLGIQDAREVGLALSEDGSHLAVLAGAKVSFFELSEPEKQGTATTRWR
jgi:hypothetical protein